MFLLHFTDTSGNHAAFNIGDTLTAYVGVFPTIADAHAWYHKNKDTFPEYVQNVTVEPVAIVK